MLGRRPKEPVGPDVWATCRELIPSGSVFAFLAEHRDALFPEEMFADLYPSANGRPSVPPQVLACATVLQVLENRTDHDAVAELRCDLRWKAACGLGLHDMGFDPSLFIYFRRRLALSGDRDRIFARVREIINETGVLKGRRRRALDSTVFEDAVATQDTVTQLIAAIRRVIREVPGAAGAAALQCTGHDYRDPGKPRIAWDDEAAREGLVDALVCDALRLLGHLPEQDLGEKAAQCHGNLRDSDKTFDRGFRALPATPPRYPSSYRRHAQARAHGVLGCSHPRSTRGSGGTMTAFGYFLACEEHRPAELVEQARMAEQAGFESLWISDHYHPWNDSQGQSPFVWSVIGALSQAVSLPVETAVTCPLVRTHPAVIAQAAATSAVQLGGRFRLGVGTGEALNEHILGTAWPEAPVRMEMLEEALQIIRQLFTGEQTSHHGKHYTVENARLYTLPDEPVPIDVSAFGPQAAEVAARIGDGLITMMPDESLVEHFRRGSGGTKPVYGGLKVCWGMDEREAVRTAHRLWATEQLPGELAQVLPTPSHFEQASQLVTEEQVAGSVPCGDDPDVHVETLTAFVDVGFDGVYVSQIGKDQQGFFDFYRTKVLPRLRG